MHILVVERAGFSTLNVVRSFGGYSTLARPCVQIATVELDNAG